MLGRREFAHERRSISSIAAACTPTNRSRRFYRNPKQRRRRSSLIHGPLREGEGGLRRKPLSCAPVCAHEKPCCLESLSPVRVCVCVRKDVSMYYKYMHNTVTQCDAMREGEGVSCSAVGGGRVCLYGIQWV